jgi:hypothetical protein
VAQQKKCDQDSRHVDACPHDLTVPIFRAEMLADAKKKDSRANGIDDWDKRYERDAHPGEKITYVFQGIPIVC